MSSVATTATAPSSGLRVGVLGLGAIGTIFFTRLSQLALQQHSAAAMGVQAFVKPRQFDALRSAGRVTLYEEPSQSQRKETHVRLRHDQQGWLSAQGRQDVGITTVSTASGSRIAAPLDVLLVALKSYDSAAAIDELRRHHAHLLRERALVVLLQNGLGALPATLVVLLQNGLGALPASLDAQRGREDRDDCQWRLVHGVTFVGGRVEAPGRIAVSGLDTGMTYLAPMELSDASTSEALSQLRRALTDAGFCCEQLSREEMKSMLWRKLIVNAGINPLASLLNASNRSVGACDWSAQCVRAVVQEAMAVARHERVDLNCSEEEMVREVLSVARNTGSNVCSMLADLRRGARTEIDAITGEIVTRGAAHGVSTPTNSFLLLAIKAIETQQLRQLEP
ncbi:hypothetical protein ATCC90586_005787 [Pythium insidiosum]|nr:hypothetical protein ATCC90586_005787 [Pythium insidiosum]